ncbi:hypothetical protein Hamer_G001428 [Homarus americanus]|uniref:Uncharacterized protein n=1 Tax=Homarus americanus TaxID=6706 RepID=A0A8J5N928_HOMAM|nr:hypothetical protein Hamer_G001428 [Homarus americanus]
MEDDNMVFDNITSKVSGRDVGNLAITFTFTCQYLSDGKRRLRRFTHVTRREEGEKTERKTLESTAQWEKLKKKTEVKKRSG